MVTTTVTLRETRVNISTDSRVKLVELLNARLADMTDYSLQLKQAHWNVRGMSFVALHEMLDEFAGQANEYADMIAERAVILGGVATGTARVVAAESTLPDYPIEATAQAAHLTALASSLGKLTSGIRAAIDQAGELGDMDTADLFTEVSRGLDKQLWYFEAHLAG